MLRCSVVRCFIRKNLGQFQFTKEREELLSLVPTDITYITQESLQCIEKLLKKFIDETDAIDKDLEVKNKKDRHSDKSNVRDSSLKLRHLESLISEINQASFFVNGVKIMNINKKESERLIPV